MASSLSAGATAQIPPAAPMNFAGSYDNSEYPTPQTVYTVPAGRRLYLTGGVFGTQSVAATALLKDDGTTFLIAPTLEGTPTTASGFPIAVLEAGSVLTTISISGGESYFFTLWGFLL